MSAETQTTEHRTNNDASRVMSDVLGRVADLENPTDVAATHLLLDATGRTVVKDEGGHSIPALEYRLELLGGGELSVELDETFTFFQRDAQDDASVRLAQSAVAFVLLATILASERSAGILTNFGKDNLPMPMEVDSKFVWKWTSTWPHTAYVRRPHDKASFERFRFLIDAVIFPDGADDESIATALSELMVGGKLAGISQDPDRRIQKLMVNREKSARRDTVVYVKMPVGDRSDRLFQEDAMLAAAKQFTSMGFVPDENGLHRLPPGKDRDQPMFQYILRRTQLLFNDKFRPVLSAVAFVDKDQFNYTGT